MFANVTTYHAPQTTTAKLPTLTTPQSESFMGLHGQPDADATIRNYLRSPQSIAFLLSGPPGTGKTSTAQFLCDQLGVDREPLGGYEEIASGGCTAESVSDLSRRLRLRPMSGCWRLIVVNEADLMSRTAEGIWLDILDKNSINYLPPNCTIVFTTNAPEKISQRFCERCEEIAYVSDAQSVRDFARSEWQRLAPGRKLPASLHSAGIREGRTPSYRLAVKDVRRAV